MFTVKKIGDRSTAGLKRITLLDEDGSETVINVSDKIHYIIAFAKSAAGAKEVAAETLVKGDSGIVGELFFQIGNAHPELIKHCVRRATETARRKARGLDPGEEAFKRARPVGGTQ